mgnify:CR=1 FL=1
MEKSTGGTLYPRSADSEVFLIHDRKNKKATLEIIVSQGWLF